VKVQCTNASLQDKSNLKEALKHASAMLQELRTSRLSPKTYFDLCECCNLPSRLPQPSGCASNCATRCHRTDHQVFDHLLFLELFFENVAASGTPVRDLYEMVQHAGNVLTRLYLMITVGSVFIKSKELPARDVLNDLLEMVKGVQHPTRGLFLRYYLLQKCEDKLPEVGSEFAGEGGSLEDALRFALTNFVEMTKLWVRMQHTTERSSQKRREKERRQIRAVVATAVGRIANLEGLTLAMFSQRVLPELLLQIQACGDKLAQEFLLDSITQSFPPHFGVATLVPYLRTLLRCSPEVDCQKIVAGHVERLTDAISRSKGDTLSARSIAEIDAAYAHSEGVGFFSLPTDHDAYRGPEGVDAAEVVAAKQEATPTDNPSEGDKTDTAAEPLAPVELGEGGIDGSGVRYSNTAPSSATAVVSPAVPVFNIFFGYMQRLIADRADSSQPIEPLTIVRLFQALLGLATSAYEGNAGHIDAILGATGAALAASEALVDANASFAVETLYGAVHAALPLPDALALPAYGVLMRPLAYAHRRAIANKLMLTALGEDPTKPQGSARPPALHLNSPEIVNQLFEALAPIIKEPEGTPPSASDEGRPATSAAALPEEFVAEQNNVARLVHLIRAQDADLTSAFKVLLAMRKHFGYGGAARVPFSLPPLVLTALHLTRRMRAANSGSVDDSEAAAAATKALKDSFKFVHQTIQALGSSGQTVRALQLSMQSAIAAAGSGFAYDFASQAFLFYEDVADSRTQVRCLDCITGGLHAAAMGGMSVEQYESLVTRATLSSTKLLRKPDQVLAVLRCAHLLWVTPAKGSGLPAYHMSAEVLHCLKRALKIADECMPSSNDLFVRIFDAYVFFFERRVPSVTATHINHNVALIQENLASMPDCEEKDSVATHFRNVMTHIATVKATTSGAELYADVNAMA
jgi:vacuolar protein sorting-associated protein 35